MTMSCKSLTQSLNISVQLQLVITYKVGSAVAQCRVLDSRPKGSGFEPHRRHCVVVLEQETFILA